MLNGQKRTVDIDTVFYLRPNQIVLNLLWQQAGGGLQNALSLIETLPSIAKPSDFIVLARSGSLVLRAGVSLGFTCCAVPPGFRAVLAASRAVTRSAANNQPCFTLFGPPLPFTRGRVLSICGVAYSNLFYPELDFWAYERPVARWAHMLKDRFRLRFLAEADFWIFETPVLAARASRLARYPSERVAVVRMTASSLVKPEKVQADLANSLNHRIPAGFRFLFLCGAAANKRVHVAAAIGLELQSRSAVPFVFVTTLPTNSRYYKIVAQSFISRGIGHLWYNIGPCSQDRVASLISVCDALCLFSVLESFSNNCVEAWRMEKPLVCTDHEWSRSSAGDAALYVDPDSVDESCGGLQSVLESAQLRRLLVENGKRVLTSYPTCEEKALEYLRFIENARCLGPLRGQSRQSLAKWNVRSE